MPYLRIDPETLNSLHQGDRAAFDLLFRKYYAGIGILNAFFYQEA